MFIIVFLGKGNAVPLLNSDTKFGYVETYLNLLVVV